MLARTAALPSFTRLGPPDLVHLAKTEPSSENNSAATDVGEGVAVSGTYYYVTGVHNASAASVSAYLSDLINSTLPITEEPISITTISTAATAAATAAIGATAAWLFGWTNQSHEHNKIQMGVYCMYNSVTRKDLRVMFKIPGSVEAYTVDEDGNKWAATDEKEWRQAWVCSILRALLYDSQEENVINIKNWYRYNPMDQMMNPANQQMFFEVFEEIFWEGPRLSLPPIANQQKNQLLTLPTLASNSLVDGFLKYVQLTGAVEPALKCLERLQHPDNPPSVETAVLTIKAKLLLQSNQEVRAVQVMRYALQNPNNLPHASLILDLQANFCMTKGKLNWALACAQKAVSSEPTDFAAWNTLVKTYTQLGMYEMALVTLNACPIDTAAVTTTSMAKFIEVPEILKPAKEFYPVPDTGMLQEVWEVQETEDDKMPLPGPALTGLMAEAYKLLTAIVGKVGWDNLLQYRSRAFIMEDEYTNNSIPIKKQTQPNGKHTQNSEQIPATISKRLCERWLDDLFMALYEDLRVYTIWRAERLYFEAQKLEDTPKSHREWEALGHVALRLHYYDEAAFAFEKSLSIKFSARVAWSLFDYYEDRLTDYPQSLLILVVKLLSHNYRWYNQFSPRLILTLKRLVASLGVTKVASSVFARYTPDSIVQLVDSALDQLIQAQAEGTDE